MHTHDRRYVGVGTVRGLAGTMALKDGGGGIGLAAVTSLQATQSTAATTPTTAFHTVVT